MNRLFETHHIRRQVSLDGIWHFRREGVEKGYSMPVPGCWERHPDFYDFRGAGTYTRQVRVEKDGNIRLEFKGISRPVAMEYVPDVYIKYIHFTPRFLDKCDERGILVWEENHARISTERFGDWRPRGRNNKDVVDEYRRPKLSCHAVKELFRRDPYGPGGR